MVEPLIMPDEQSPASEFYFDLAATSEGSENAREAVLLSIAASLMEIRGALVIQNGILAELLVYLPKGR